MMQQLLRPPFDGDGRALSTIQWCNSMIRMMSGIGIPTSQRRIGMVFSLQV
jgi:hypothetical protein